MQALRTPAFWLCFLTGAAGISAAGAGTPAPRELLRPPAASVPLSLDHDDVLATGNQWIALPEIAADDGAIQSFNVLSMHEHGLLQVNGARNAPALRPTLTIDGRRVTLHGLRWSLLGYWVPVAQFRSGGILLTLTYCAPIGARAAFVHVSARNLGSAPERVDLGMEASWGSLSRVIYAAMPMRGTLDAEPAPWLNQAQMFRYGNAATEFAWVLSHPGADGRLDLSLGERDYRAHREIELAAGATARIDFILGVGLEEYGAATHARSLRRMIALEGARAVIARTADWCASRGRTTGRADLDLLMNRNLLFTRFYAWGRTLDTEQLVGVTSRSPRYYVSAAYWDRDAMLWSFPGLLRSDPAFAREALGYALTTQLIDTGVHSRYIDGAVLEDGFELDEAAAPLIAFADYERATGDLRFLRRHRDALDVLEHGLLARKAASGLYRSVQDSQDENRAQQFMTYDNALVWKAFQDLSYLRSQLREPRRAAAAVAAAGALRAAILARLVRPGAPGAAGPIFAFGSDGRTPYFDDVPPGSLLRLPLIGFIAQSDPVFQRTYAWLHSKDFPYSFHDQPDGLPGSYRLPSTTVWSIADHLLLQRGNEAALRILLASHWDAGIAAEGLDPADGRVRTGAAFATAAGYLAAAICDRYCLAGRGE